MATESQWRARKTKQRQQQKKRQKQRAQRSSVVRASARQGQRVARQRPRAWSGEQIEDVAVFDASVREALPPELAEQASAVREALISIYALRDDEANARVASIPRSSPFSEWRLLIRGLLAWTEGADLAKATAFWDRLNRQRRPGRIATALIAAHRTDLSSVKTESVTHESGLEDDSIGLDTSLLYAAKLVRRSCIERRAIAHAEVGTSQRDESSELLIGPKKIEWLKSFSAEFQDFEPELVKALQREALHRAFAQSYVDLFEQVARIFLGPPHDPNNTLLSFCFHADGGSQEKARRHLKRYVTEELPRNDSISGRLRDALISQCYLNEARSKITASVMAPFGSGFAAGFTGMMGSNVDDAAIDKDLKKSIKAYPTHLAAHEKYTDWLQSTIDDDRTSTARRKTVEASLGTAMKSWSKALPDNVEPRLWLVDDLLEKENLDEAKPHVDWLATSRQQDPRARAAPWKWQLLEAMRLCRRKAWLDDVSERLAAAEATWPKWLSMDWLAYLRAALSLRMGAVEEFQQQRTEICEARGVAQDSLSDACMMLAAGQRMRVPAADLKSLRVPVDEAVKQAGRLRVEEIIAAGDFFWDLHRTSLLYPAYRMHGSKFARELRDRLTKQPEAETGRIDDPRFQNAVLWLSAHRFASPGYDTRVPPMIEAASRHAPKIAAAILNGTLKSTYTWGLKSLEAETEFVREASRTDADVYYRFWFGALAEQVQDKLASDGSSMGMFGTFSDMFSRFASKINEDLDDDDPELDFGCNCPRCTAARRAAGHSKRPGEPSGPRSQRFDLPF